MEMSQTVVSYDHGAMKVHVQCLPVVFIEPVPMSITLETPYIHILILSIIKRKQTPVWMKYHIAGIFQRVKFCGFRG